MFVHRPNVRSLSVYILEFEITSYHYSDMIQNNTEIEKFIQDKVLQGMAFPAT